MATAASWPKHLEEVGLAVQLTPLCEARSLQSVHTDAAANTVLMQGKLAHLHNHFVYDALFAAGALHASEMSRLFSLQIGILLIFPRTRFSCSPLRSDHNPIGQSEHPATRGVGTACLITQTLPLATCGQLSAKEMMFSSDSINKDLAKGAEVTPDEMTLSKTCSLSGPAGFM